eukprot:m.151068 g.151068  ORF g.151068 m.151068 type:complete len:63 (-) comp15034_c0_seq10:223-411(-)
MMNQLNTVALTFYVNKNIRNFCTSESLLLFVALNTTSPESEGNRCNSLPSATVTKRPGLDSI